MILLGTIVNVVLVIIGAIIGTYAKHTIPKRFADLIMDAIALVTIMIGISFTIQSKNILLVVVSLVIGGMIGEWVDIDARLTHLAEYIKNKISYVKGNFVEGMVTATLLFCVGSMAVMGALDSGLRGNHTLLYTKAVMDGISAMIFSSTLGIGVIFSVFPLFIYQGTITLLASVLENFLSEAIILEVSAVGGVLLLGLGISILNIKKIKVTNLLPALIIPIFLSFFH